ncbi:S1C family serine protease [Bradyrhizobium sp. sGM-13]|uniref:S1C family serine protease n=1 Tax=Bradyrhizobium sp. sGM-13 TaxID=2831781 RepID=UPI001BD03125|nr:trypsin-like peptidase domain-containing protein [Bradyrhizobium sp. sGM-13]
MGGTIAAIVVIASIAQAQTINTRGQTPFAREPSTLMHWVADSRGGGGPDDFADLAERVQPAVIGVSSKAAVTSKGLPDRLFGAPDQRPPNKQSPGPNARDQLVSFGSGFFISADGYAVTNSHVVEDGDTAEIRTNDNKTYSAKVIGKDSLTDVALIKVDGRSDFSYVKLVDQLPRVGDWVLAAGSPFGLGGTVTAGIVSARERDIETGSATDFIQIDAPINQGNSGGPSFNARGDVVGVNSKILSSSEGSVGVAFAVPADTVKAVVSQLKDKGAVTRGWIGAKVQPVTPDIADSLGVNDLHGAIVASVQDDGPAARAGLRRGDVITAAEGQPIRNAKELTKKIHAMAPGSSIRLAMLREGRENSLNVALGQMPDQAEVPPAIRR